MYAPNTLYMMHNKPTTATTTNKSKKNNMKMAWDVMDW